MRITTYAADPMTGKPLGPRRTRKAHHGEPPAPDEVEPAKSEPTDDGEQYPADGTISEVLEWVDRAPNQGLRSDRAKAATAAEAGRENPRSTLLPQLAERTG